MIVAETGELPDTLQIIDVIKPAAAGTPRRGDVVRFVERGRIITDAPIAPRTGYLLFARVTPGGLVITPDSSFEFSDDGLALGVTRRASRPFEDDDLHSLPAVEVLRHVREHVSAGVC